MMPTNGRSLAIIRNRQFKTMRSTRRLAQVKPGKFYCESRRSGECAPMGASSFVVSRRAFQGLTETAAGDCALFLLPSTKTGGRRNGCMQKEAFRIWLEVQYPGSRHVGDVICRCGRLEAVYGDLDIAYTQNHCTAIEAEFTYSKSDERNGKPTGHGIAVNGSCYSLTHDLLDALRKYVAFGDSHCNR